MILIKSYFQKQIGMDFAKGQVKSRCLCCKDFTYLVHLGWCYFGWKNSSLPIGSAHFICRNTQNFRWTQTHSTLCFKVMLQNGEEINDTNQNMRKRLRESQSTLNNCELLLISVTLVEKQKYPFLLNMNPLNWFLFQIICSLWFSSMTIYSSQGLIKKNMSSYSLSVVLLLVHQ